MTYSWVRFIVYLLFAITMSTIVVFITGSLEKNTEEKRIKKELKSDIGNTARTFKKFTSGPDAENTITFMKDYLATVLFDEVFVVDISAGEKPAFTDAIYLFAFEEGAHRLDIYIKKSYLDNETEVIDAGIIIEAIVVTIIVFTVLLIYSEKKRQALVMQEKYKARATELTKTLQEQEALVLLGRMAATLAHELKTPIATISNLIHVLPNRLADEKFTKKFVALTKEELLRTQHLIDNLLIYGKEISVINDEWIPFRGFFEELCIVNGLDILSCPDFVLYGDRFYMRLLFENLLRNSVQAGAKGVFIRIERQPESDEQMTAIYYEDNGQGFPSDIDLMELFNPFITMRPKGAGLGLYLVQKIVAAHSAKTILYRPPHGAGVGLILPSKRVRINDKT